MRLLFIRHGDPDYENDTLTEKGHIEAKLLSQYIKNYHIDEAYVSPLGRARDTAQYSLDALGMTDTTLDWLREFPGQVDPNVSDTVKKAYETALIYDEDAGKYKTRIMWDILPSFFNDHPELFDKDAWRNSPLLEGSDVLPIYDNVIREFDALLARNGYVRDGLTYKVEKNNEKTIAFFCHYGLTCVLLSRLWNVAPFVPMQFTALAPTSVTEVVTEERQKGIAVFRTLKAGDVSHLAVGGEEPSFSARFCERFENEDQRH
ncbi:histidine phosphatase family protein [Pseudobutyrivibrio sp.]|uniref:histidine phosphatase family protein n=1 Tax=Pseudobutyrivibrio sp. TaxID=2014367 RepID=UPI0025E7FB69|nr:histidine phosphatase family protein [Pseudobutyrivibrio sp.]MBR5649994.1 histidine phosphatase family protein [Pseudobutyrivibrio sp.]